MEETARPVCCGSEMETNMELGRFTELHCSRCGDVVFVKSTSVFW